MTHFTVVLVSSVSPYGDHSRWIHFKHAFLLLPYIGELHTVHLNALSMRLVVLGSINCIMTDCGFHVVLRDFINVRFMCWNGGYLCIYLNCMLLVLQFFCVHAN